MRRFVYKEDMGFFKITDNNENIPTFFVDTKEDADKVITLFNITNPSIIDNKIILRWDTIGGLKGQNVFFNDTKMDKLCFEIEEIICGMGLDINIKEKHSLNLKNCVLEQGTHPTAQALRKCPILNNYMDNYNYILNHKFVLFEGVEITKQTDLIIKEIEKYFPSCQVEVISKPVKDLFDVVITF